MFPTEPVKEEDVPQKGLLLLQIHTKTTVHTVGNLATKNLKVVALPALTYYNHTINLNNKYHQWLNNSLLTQVYHHNPHQYMFYLQLHNLSHSRNCQPSYFSQQ